MATESNIAYVYVQGAPSTVPTGCSALSLEAYPTSLGSGGGAVTLTASCSSGLSGITVTFYELTTSTRIGSTVTDGTGEAQMTANIPANTSTAPATFAFQADA